MIWAPLWEFSINFSMLDMQESRGIFFGAFKFDKDRMVLLRNRQVLISNLCIRRVSASPQKRIGLLSTEKRIMFIC